MEIAGYKYRQYPQIALHSMVGLPYGIFEGSICTPKASPVAALILRRLTEPANREVYKFDHAEAEARAPAGALPAILAVIGIKV